MCVRAFLPDVWLWYIKSLAARILNTIRISVKWSCLINRLHEVLQQVINYTLIMALFSHSTQNSAFVFPYLQYNHWIFVIP